jgi:hypothetical protein
VATLLGAGLRIARAAGLTSQAAGVHRASSMDRPRGPALPVGRDPEGLTRWQAARAESRLAALRPDGRLAVQQALQDARTSDRAYLRRALAAGRSSSEIVALAARVADQPPGWARTHLRLVDDTPGTQWRCGVRIAQPERTMCGTTVLLVLATSADPVLTGELTTPEYDPDGAGFGRRYQTALRLIQGQSRRVWPTALGTTPTGMVRWLARYAAGVGPYRVRLVDDESPADLATLIREVNTALELGDQVPLLVGTALPRHYVLALAQRPPGPTPVTEWRVYEPSSGEVRVVPKAALAERGLAAQLGAERVHAALLPGR